TPPFPGPPPPPPRPGRSGGECPAPEPHHVPGLAPHPVGAADLRGHHRRCPFLLRSAYHHAVVAPAPGRVRAGRIAPGDLSGSSRVKVLLTNPQFWIRCAEIGFLNLLLSGDNAVVIALAGRPLPRRQRLLRPVWGTVGAVALRLVFVTIVSVPLRLPP